MGLVTLKESNNNYNLWFQRIANQLLQSKLYINEQEYEIIDITIHFYSNEHFDLNIYKDSIQKETGLWMIKDNPMVLDFSFCDQNDQSSYGGVFIRGIKAKDGHSLSSPSQIFRQLESEFGVEFITVINGENAFSSNLRIELSNSQDLVSFYQLTRPNAYISSKEFSDSTNLDIGLYPYRFSKVFPSMDKMSFSYRAAIALCSILSYDKELSLYFDHEDVALEIERLKKFEVEEDDRSFYEKSKLRQYMMDYFRDQQRS